MRLKSAFLALSLLFAVAPALAEPPSYLPREVVRREKLLKFVQGTEINEGEIKISVGVYQEEGAGEERVTQVVLHPLVPLDRGKFKDWWAGKISSAPGDFRDRFLNSVGSLDEGEQAALTFYPGGGDVMMGTRDKVKFTGQEFRAAVLPLFTR